jgi:hypothetical protein
MSDDIQSSNSTGAGTMSNVIAFPRTPAALADAERAAILAAIEKALADLNEATRLAHGGVRYELQYVEAEA